MCRRAYLFWPLWFKHATPSTNCNHNSHYVFHRSDTSLGTAHLSLDKELWGQRILPNPTGIPLVGPPDPFLAHRYLPRHHHWCRASGPGTGGHESRRKRRRVEAWADRCIPRYVRHLCISFCWFCCATQATGWGREVHQPSARAVLSRLARHPTVIG